MPISAADAFWRFGSHRTYLVKIGPAYIKGKTLHMAKLPQTVLEDDLGLSEQSETVPRQCIDIVVYCPRQSKTVQDSGLGFLEIVRDSSSDSLGQ
jgi:hypothetical protein